MNSFLVIGLGRFGVSVAENLYKMGNDVLVVDKNPQFIQQISGSVTDAVAGDCCDINVLKSLDAASFDCAVVAISADMEASILITYNLKLLGVGKVLAKATSDAHEEILKKIGADRVVFPEKQSGIKIAQELSSHDILDFPELSTDISIFEMTLPKKWAGKSLRDLSLRNIYGINIIAVKKANSSDFEVNIDPDTPFEETDTIVIIGENSKVERMKK